MATAASQPIVSIYPDSLKHNWQRIVRIGDAGSGAWPSRQARRWPGHMAMVKADAYGHGLSQVSRTLFALGARAFGVGNVAEGVRLYRALPPALRHEAFILPLLGIHSAREADQALAHAFIPLIHRFDQIALMAARHTGPEPLPVAVKVDTGMSRLGFGPDSLPELIDALRCCPALRPDLLVSHLASADEPDKLLSVEGQHALFVDFLQAFRRVWPGITPSLANSAGALNDGVISRALGCHVRRTGFSLYGGNPFASSCLAEKGHGFLPVMQMAAPILELRHIQPGTRVSYGGTFTATAPMRIAAVGAGYAEGLSRALSAGGGVCINGHRAPIIGRVCMQMHMVDVSHIPPAACGVGQMAYILGGAGAGRVSAESLAAALGTIPYEVFCMLGKNKRVIREGLPTGYA